MTEKIDNPVELVGNPIVKGNQERDIMFVCFIDENNPDPLEIALLINPKFSNKRVLNSIISHLLEIIPQVPD